MKGFCEKCNKWVDGEITTINMCHLVKNDKINMKTKILKCTKCAENLYCEDIDSKTQMELFDIYKKKHKLLTAKQIKEIRLQYNLSQRSLSKLLNWGDKTIWRYELGSIQDKAHDSMLKYISSPVNMKEYIKNNETGLEQKRINDVLQAADEIITKKKNVGSFIEKITYDLVPFELGNVEFSYEKFKNAVVFFAYVEKTLQKVKLMKLLYYSDNLFYKSFGQSITGAQYIHYPYGPVPANYEDLLTKMINEKLINVDIKYKENFEMHLIKPLKKFESRTFSNDEIGAMQKVCDYFKNWGSAKIANFSHKETGYKKTTPGQIISYDFAKDINL